VMSVCSVVEAHQPMELEVKSRFGARCHTLYSRLCCQASSLDASHHIFFGRSSLAAVAGAVAKSAPPQPMLHPSSIISTIYISVFQDYNVESRHSDAFVLINKDTNHRHHLEPATAFPHFSSNFSCRVWC
jgi:hypothetical protein